MKIFIRQGELADVSWITSLLKEGSRSGHFSPTVEDQAYGLLTSIINNDGLIMIKLRGGIQAPNFVPASILVAEIENEPASFLILLKEKKEIELHLAATKKKFRRKGCFRALIQHVISEHSDSEKIFSRCYKKSTWAMKALIEEGFEITKNGNPLELALKLEPAKNWLKRLLCLTKK